MAAVALRLAILTGLWIFCECQRHGPYADQYMGCYKDDRDRALGPKKYKEKSEPNSNGKCIRECGLSGFTFAGTEASIECFCGNRYDYDRHGHTQNECTRDCSGNNAETCGGNWRLQIYSDCGVEKGGCQHRCTEDKTDEWCSCDDGFWISPDDWKQCVGMFKAKQLFIGKKDGKMTVNRLMNAKCNLRYDEFERGGGGAGLVALNEGGRQSVTASTNSVTDFASDVATVSPLQLGASAAVSDFDILVLAWSFLECDFDFPLDLRKNETTSIWYK
ncbi:hypothetical protein CAPTEDRAFT_189201 [Capitella teleta]|uniref:WSC domain-containing protein n=1 Tax=Capitella teleta TaxID=283909 RepID=R7VJY1_CAPTE|nr:hypothetical protein CAPTEDRAFT_189201 [Capitella teleta]|eukprot:ELU16876.1 hypothetical protein CAPTEDRAFT_189201 [Capitella teleta]